MNPVTKPAPKLSTMAGPPTPSTRSIDAHAKRPTMTPAEPAMNAPAPAITEKRGLRLAKSPARPMAGWTVVRVWKPGIGLFLPDQKGGEAGDLDRPPTRLLFQAGKLVVTR